MEAVEAAAEAQGVGVDGGGTGGVAAGVHGDIIALVLQQQKSASLKPLVRGGGEKEEEERGFYPFLHYVRTHAHLPTCVESLHAESVCFGQTSDRGDRKCFSAFAPVLLS